MTAPSSRTGATDREVEAVVVTLTHEQAAETTTALFDYRIETDRYLAGYAGSEVGHADCCDVAQRRDALREEQRQSLRERLASINGALDALDAARAALLAEQPGGGK